jgi:hypothetical protein
LAQAAPVAGPPPLGLETGSAGAARCFGEEENQVRHYQECNCKCAGCKTNRDYCYDARKGCLLCRNC